MTTNGSIIIEGIDLHRTYAIETAPVEVLKGVSLQIRRGETTAITGASGAGKSTLLHILGALDRPTRGSVFFDGVDVYSMSESDRSSLRSKRIGFVFQAYHLLPELNVLENVVLPARREWGVWRRWHQVEQRAQDLLAQVGLAHRLKHRPSELSGGEQQRVAIARALINSPDVIMADEPTGNLDSATGEQVLSCLFELVRDRGVTLVLVTHNEALADRCQRRFRLVDGRLA